MFLFFEEFLNFQIGTGTGSQLTVAYTHTLHTSYIFEYFDWLYFCVTGLVLLLICFSFSLVSPSSISTWHVVKALLVVIWIGELVTPNSLLWGYAFVSSSKHPVMSFFKLKLQAVNPFPVTFSVSLKICFAQSASSAKDSSIYAEQHKLVSFNSCVSSRHLCKVSCRYLGVCFVCRLHTTDLISEAAHAQSNLIYWSAIATDPSWSLIGG